MNNVFMNASVLITGGTGTLGKALVKRLLAPEYGLKRLVIFSRDEQKQFQMAHEFSPEEYSCLRYFIGDVRDLHRLRQALNGIDMVIHAAAMKHIHIAEYNPMECIQTNIMGGQNVITACIEKQVKHVVALSTDKAAAPINLYGATKLASDKLFVASNALVGDAPTRFSVVRYGNVMGSNGSVAPFFLKKREDGVLPITDPRMTRFNITIRQAVDLVLYALGNAKGGEIFVPKLPSYRITDLATAIGPDCRQEVVGIRPGEKIHEEMITSADSYYTHDLGDYFVILPPKAPAQLIDSMEANGYTKVPEGFHYQSGSNDQWMSVEGLQEQVAIELGEDGYPAG
jgi:UDP-N-acetylglucosamine 4,6-dehydratase (inverting)